MVAHAQASPIQSPNAPRMVAPSDATGPNKLLSGKRRRPPSGASVAAGGEPCVKIIAELRLAKERKLGIDCELGFARCRHDRLKRTFFHKH